MAKKVFTFTVGTLLFAPIVLALMSNSTMLVFLSVFYAAVLWHSPKFSTRIRKFWLEFWRVNMEILNFYSL